MSAARASLLLLCLGLTTGATADCKGVICTGEVELPHTCTDTDICAKLTLYSMDSNKPVVTLMPTEYSQRDVQRIKRHSNATIRNLLKHISSVRQVGASGCYRIHSNTKFNGEELDLRGLNHIKIGPGHKYSKTIIK